MNEERTPVFADPNMTDYFALRAHERVRIGPLEPCHTIAVRLVHVEPPGPMAKACNVGPDAGLPVEHFALVAAQRDPEGIWHWLGMARGTKAIVGSLVATLNHGGEWLGMSCHQD